jgi:integrase
MIPIHDELLLALKKEKEHRRPSEVEFVLLLPALEAQDDFATLEFDRNETRANETQVVAGFTLRKHRLYYRVLAIGSRGGVKNCHPHRFRSTFAVGMMNGGANALDVARLLGDTVETVVKHYLPFVKELRERVRKIMNGCGETKS